MIAHFMIAQVTASCSPVANTCSTGVATERVTTSFASVLQNHMAAANTLLTAAGLFKTSTATELATSSSQSDAAAPTDDVSLLPLTGLPMSPSASDESFLLGDLDLEKIVALLLWIAMDFQSYIHRNDIHIAALDALIKHTDSTTGSTFVSLHTAAVAKLSNLIDILSLIHI